MAPKLRCRELTGADCDRPVALDAADCGIAEHVVPPQAVKRAPGRASIPMAVRRPTLVVDEEFDLFEDDDEAVWNNIDLCKVSKITLHYDRKARTTTADFD